jgi:hypothetical protein
MTENELLEKLRQSFPKTAPYSRDPLQFARNYIDAIQAWAKEHLGVNFDENF